VTDQRPRPGPSTRAIRAASRVPDVHQVPTSVPIYQTATFASGDAGELAGVLGGDQPGYASSRIDNPDGEIAAGVTAVGEIAAGA
jgi:O-acetylhomoserine/O-acetylserine sulfhydrylase-like pyridoxal-dependent enzyme